MKRIEPLPREPGAPFSGARADIWLPPVALASCIRAVMSRDTRGVEMASEERCNYFPASPTCAINWYFEGNFELLDSDRQVQADSRNGPLGRMTFSGPFVRPVIVRNPGPMHAMVLLIMPDALPSTIASGLNDLKSIFWPSNRSARSERIIPSVINRTPSPRGK